MRHFLLVVAVLLAACSTPEKRKETAQKELAATYNTQLGIGYMKQGEMASAKDRLNKALQLAPNLPEVHYAMGFYLEKTGELVEAEQHFKRAIQLAPTLGEVSNNYGTFLCRNNRFAEAETYFLQAVEDPQYNSTAKAYENAGLCALKAGQQTQARTYFLQAVRHDLRSSAALIELAQWELDQGNSKQADFYLQHYRRYGEETARSLWLSIQAAYLLGQQQSVSAYKIKMAKNFSKTHEYRLMQEYLTE